MTNEEDHFADPYAFTDSEIAEIMEGCKTFPGNWFLDPAIDYRRAGSPRVWVHPTAGDLVFGMSLGFTKEDNLFYVGIQPHADSGDIPKPGIPFATLRDALIMCKGSLEIAMKHAGKHGLEVGIRAVWERARRPDPGKDRTTP